MILKPFGCVFTLLNIAINQSVFAQKLDIKSKNEETQIFAKNNESNKLVKNQNEKIVEEFKIIVEDLKPPSKKRIYIHNLVGIQSPQFANLNADLAKNGFMKLNKTYLSRGGGFYTIFPKTNLATLFNYSTYSANSTEGNFTNSVRGTTVGTSFGVSIAPKSNFQLIPFGGIVYSWFGARLSKNSAINQTFSAYLGSGANQQHIASQGFTGNLGIHFAGAPFKKTGRLKNINLGLRIGKYVPISDNKWTTNGQKLEGGPNINSQGLYASFLLGSSL